MRVITSDFGQMRIGSVWFGSAVYTTIRQNFRIKWVNQLLAIA